MITTEISLFEQNGFFADSQFRSAFQREHDCVTPRSSLETSEDRSTVTGRNPLVLSGIVLAGANLPRKQNDLGAPAGDDGILTAEEVLDLDLASADLVVLSACETGLGEVAGGEGVFGLQRGFGLAGSRTVVVSLWKVDDSATHALMVEFYRNLWEQKLGKLESLRQAQLAMIRRYDPKQARMSEPRGLTLTTKDRREPTLAPFHWAAFTLSGDWR